MLGKNATPGYKILTLTAAPNSSICFSLILISDQKVIKLSFGQQRRALRRINPDLSTDLSTGFVDKPYFRNSENYLAGT